MRIASFNVENLFRRPIALNQDTWAQGKPILENFSKLVLLLEKATYTTADKTKILDLLELFGLDRQDEGPFVILRRSRGQLVKRPKAGPVEVTASGRGDWIGWLELKREAVNEAATRNTARAVAELKADVLAIVEAEDRPALQRFTHDVLDPHITDTLPKSKRWTYSHVMLIDGNDDRGIDVGIMTRKGHPISLMRSHVDDLSDSGFPVFSRDCAEYVVDLPGSSKQLLVMINHYKSKGYGSQGSSDAKREAQADRSAELYEQRRQEGFDLIAVVGDLNDTPDSVPLKPLMSGSDLTDISEHPKFDRNHRDGTYGTGNDKIDYVLLSPALFAKATGGGVFRKGVWRGPKVKDPWDIFDTLTRPEEAASDHAAIYADIAL